jgi:hypothetical protein
MTLITVSTARQINGAGQSPKAGGVKGREKELAHERARLPMHIITCVDSQA